MGGGFYPIGGGIAAYISKNVPNVRATAVTSGGVNENITRLNIKTADIGLVSSGDSYAAFRGLSPYKKKYDKMRSMGVLYRALSRAIDEELVASAHGIYRGGLSVHLAMVAMGGNLGMQVDLGLVPVDQLDCNDVILFSESAGRFIVTIDPENRESFDKIFKGLNFACIGTITAESDFIIKGIGRITIVKVPVHDLKTAWKQPFGELI